MLAAICICSDQHFNPNSHHILSKPAAIGRMPYTTCRTCRKPQLLWFHGIGPLSGIEQRGVKLNSGNLSSVLTCTNTTLHSQCLWRARENHHIQSAVSAGTVWAYSILLYTAVWVSMLKIHYTFDDNARFRENSLLQSETISAWRRPVAVPSSALYIYIGMTGTGKYNNSLFVKTCTLLKIVFGTNRIERRRCRRANNLFR